MDKQAKVGRMAKYSSLTVDWFGRVAIFLVLIAVLGFTQNLYGLDVRLSANAPRVQVRLVVFDSLPRISWRKLVNFAHALWDSSSSHEEACREGQKRAIG